MSRPTSEPKHDLTSLLASPDVLQRLSTMSALELIPFLVGDTINHIVVSEPDEVSNYCSVLTKAKRTKEMIEIEKSLTDIKRL